MRFLRLTLTAGVLCASVLSFSSCATSPQAKSAKYMDAGKKLMDKNDPARAILQFQNAVKAVPNAEGYYRLATAFLAAGDVDNGVAAVRKALDLDSKYEPAEMLLARLEASVGPDRPELLQSARKRLEALLQEGPGDADALQALALTELKLGEPENALRELGRAVLLAPQNLTAAVSLAQTKLQQGDSKGAQEALKQAVQNNPKSVTAVVLLAKLYSAENQPEDAEQQFQKALSMDGNDTGALYGLGVLQMKMGKKQQAEETFRKLSRLPDKAVQTSFAAFLNQEGRKDETVQEMTRLCKENPDDRRLRTLLVKSYVIANRVPEALKLLNDVLKRNPKDQDALLQSAELALDANNPTQAELNLNQLVHMQVNSPEVHYTLGRLYLARNEVTRYRQELTEALRLNASLLPVRVELAQNLVNDKDGRSALDVLNGAPAFQKTAVPLLVQRNWANWVLNDMAEMRKGIDEGMAQQRTPDLLLQDGLWKLRNGDAKGARAAVEEVLKIDPADVRALKVLSRSYLAEKNSKGAVQRVKEFAAQQPKSAAVQDFLGMLLVGTGDPADRTEARAAFSAAKAADPHFDKADMALVQVDVLEGKMGDARKRLEGVVTTNGSNLTARRWLGNLDEMAGDHKAAIDQFRKVVAGDDKDAQALNNLAYLLMEYGNSPDEALKVAQKAVELVPDRPAYCDTLGWAFYQKGLYSSAIPYLQKASADPQDVVWKYHLAMAYAKAGNLKSSRMMLDAALKVNSRVPEAKQAQEVFQESH